MDTTYKVYKGNDLGAVYAKDKTTFRVWAPTAERVQLCLYKQGNEDFAYAIEDMKASEEGTWFLEVTGDLHTVYYTYLVTVEGVTRETNDPYAKACGVNGIRSMVVDMSKTNPEGFADDKGPVVEKETDIIVCEISVADTTADVSCHAKNPGKYIGLTETGLKNDAGMATGLDHMKELGVTHIQIMPSYDFGSIDESRLDIPQYNWGYDPVNYNIPEGSYSTDPFHGEVRIKEFKQMVQALHENGFGVIMDVVYNHTFNIDDNCFQKCVPDYYYRKTETGYSDASACGNEVASDKPMVRKFIIDSLIHWTKEYHIDGYRFDLMGVLDIETMQLAKEELEKIRPGIIIYGEGWTGGDSTLPAEERALKMNVLKMKGIGAFSDDIRDAVKGHVFNMEECGFVNGAPNMENDIRFGITGGCKHLGVDYDAYTYSDAIWAKDPVDTVNYVSCHDNLTLWDKLAISVPEASEKERLAMNRLAAAIIMTSQGIPFFLSGEEFARTKPIEGTNEVSENSYNLPLYTNSMKYDRLAEYKDLYEYYCGLIQLRKDHALFRLGTTEEVQKALIFVEDLPANVVAYTLENETEKIFVAFNANNEEITIALPNEKEWSICVEDEKASKTELRTATTSVKIGPISCLVAIQK